MLEQILQDMFVDPDLLTELNDEQKQILFFRMRQEQIRRWNTWQTNLKPNDQDNFQPIKPRRSDSLKVNFILGTDGMPKVSIFGVECSKSMQQTAECRSKVSNEKRMPMSKKGTVVRPPRKQTSISSTTTVTEDEVLCTDDSRQLEQLWRDQLQISKLHDDERKSVAKRVRESIDESMYCQVDLKSFNTRVRRLPNNNNNNRTTRRKPKPSCRDDVVKWFNEVEEPRGAGINATTGKLAKWFNGIISREEAENQLRGRPEGTFMVRVSDKIWGYVISYCCGGNKFKHYLVDAADAGYRFLGAEQFMHLTLAELVEYHQVNPLSLSGHETLKFPCGHSSTTVDVKDVINDTKKTSSASVTSSSSSSSLYVHEPINVSHL